MKEIRRCLQCDKQFMIHPAWIRKGGGVYCSRPCKWLANKGRVREGSRATRSKICRVCMKEFVPGRKSTQHEWDRSLCSLECWHESIRKPVEHRLSVIKANYRRKAIKSQDLKRECLTAYGGVHCSCCGEGMIEFLTLDHVKNDPKRYMLKTGAPRMGVHLYGWLRNNGYPDKEEFQVLCMNCNWAKHKHGGVCPHQIAAQKLFLLA